MKHNGFGYDFGAACGRSSAADLLRLAGEIRAGKASPGLSTIEAKFSFI
jgi:hypothetical protein